LPPSWSTIHHYGVRVDGQHLHERHSTRVYTVFVPDMSVYIHRVNCIPSFLSVRACLGVAESGWLADGVSVCLHLLDACALSGGPGGLTVC